MSKYGQIEITYELTLDAGHCGSFDFYLSESEVKEYNADPKKFIEQRLGCPFWLYEEWLENEGSVRCAATTKRGTKCKCIVKGGHMMCLHSYIALRNLGRYCPLHEKPGGGRV